MDSATKLPRLGTPSSEAGPLVLSVGFKRRRAGNKKGTCEEDWRLRTQDVTGQASVCRLRRGCEASDRPFLAHGFSPHPFTAHTALPFVGDDIESNILPVCEHLGCV
jgi:hypothetical protein